MLKTGRTLAMTLAAWGCGMATTCMAQSYGAGGVVTLPASASGYDYSSGAFGDNGAAFTGTAPAGYDAGGAYCPPQPGYGPACEPEPMPWWKKHSLCLSPRLLKPPRGAFFRTEYLLWEIEQPGSVLLGADPPKELSGSSDFLDFGDNIHPEDPNRIFENDFDPADGFIAFDPVTFDPFDEFGDFFKYTPRMDELQLRDNSGIRLTLGIPTYEYGTIELSGWMLEQATDNYRFAGREIFPPGLGILPIDPTDPDEDDFILVNSPGIPFTPATLINVDGANAQQIIRSYDVLDVVYKSDLWGADAKFVVDALSPPGEGLKIKPIFGFKYVALNENMEQRGVSQPTVGATTISSINSSTANNIFGGTVGLRTELVHRWFVAGLQPAVTFAGNVSEARVATDRLLGNADPYREVESDYFDFSPILDLNAYARICLTDNLRVTVGYDAFWLARVYRPARVIDYNLSTDGGTTIRSDFGTRKRADHVAVEGLSLGLEYIF